MNIPTHFKQRDLIELQAKRTTCTEENIYNQRSKTKTKFLEDYYWRDLFKSFKIAKTTARHMWTVFDKSMNMKSRLQSLRAKKYKYSWDVLSLPQSVFKVVILGAGGVGKTSLVMRFVRDYFPQKYIPTVEDVYEKTVTLSKDFGAFFEIMDTAGSYQFPAMKRLTIEHGNAFVLVYSLDDESSLHEALRIQKEIVEIKGTRNVPILLVGNKTDLVDQEVLDKTRALVAGLVEEQNILTSETSAKFGVNVSGVFYALLGQIAVVNRVGAMLKRDCLAKPISL